MAKKLNVEIGLNTSGLNSGLSRAESSIKSWAGSVKSQIAAAFSVAAISTAMKATVAYIDQVGDAANSLNMPVERFQALALVARQAGLEVQKVTTLMLTLADAQAKIIANPTGPEAINMERMGIDKNDAINMTPDELMIRMADQLQGTSLTEKASFLKGIVGKEEIGTFNRLSPAVRSGFDEQLKSLLDRGYIATEKQVESIKIQTAALSAEWTRLKISLIPLAQTFTSVLADVTHALGSWINDIKKAYGQGKSTGEQPEGMGIYSSTAAQAGRTVDSAGNVRSATDVKNIGSTFNNALLTVMEFVSETLKPVGQVGSAFIPGSPINREITDAVFGVGTAKPNHDPSALPIERRKLPVEGITTGALGIMKLVKDSIDIGTKFFNEGFRPDPNRGITQKEIGPLASRSIYSDSLLSVGNFLGSNLTGISSTASSLDELRKQTRLLKSIDSKLGGSMMGTGTYN